MLKKLLFATLLLMLVLTACGGNTNGDANGDMGDDVSDDTGTDADTDTGEAEEFKFGMILVGPKNDRGWSQAHHDGGTYVEANLEGAEMIVFDLMNPADKPEATLEGVVDDMVAAGAKLIFTTSDEFEEDTLTVAQKYPDVVFINISPRKTTGVAILQTPEQCCKLFYKTLLPTG